MTLFLKTPKASPQARSAVGSQPAAVAYQAMQSGREGRPGGVEVEDDGGMKAGLMRPERRELAWWEERAKV